MWRWQLKTCWSCWWWETVYSVTFSIQFLTVLKSFSRLDSNSLTFLQLVKAVKTLTGGATWSIIYFDFACTTNFPFLFLMAPVQKYMRWADLVIGPESDHCLLLSLTDWLTDSLTNCCLVNLIDVSLACEDGNSKLVEVAFLDWNQIV